LERVFYPKDSKNLCRNDGKRSAERNPLRRRGKPGSVERKYGVFGVLKELHYEVQKRRVLTEKIFQFNLGKLAKCGRR